MYLHMRFRDGSKPVVKYGTENDLFKYLRKWDKNYDLLIDRVPGIINKKWQDVGLEVLAIEKVMMEA